MKSLVSEKKVTPKAPPTLVEVLGRQLERGDSRPQPFRSIKAEGEREKLKHVSTHVKASGRVVRVR